MEVVALLANVTVYTPWFVHPWNQTAAFPAQRAIRPGCCPGPRADRGAVERSRVIKRKQAICCLSLGGAWAGAALCSAVAI